MGDIDTGTSLTLPNGWRPRPYQMSIWKALASGCRHVFVLAHRRWGKDDVALHHTACAAWERVGNYAHMLPLYSQARKAIWNAVNPHSGLRRIDEAFPEAMRAKTLDDEMYIQFKNGSSWQVLGSDSYNAVVGSSYAGLVYSEYALGNPSAQGYFTPMLMENGGWELLITTPRGKNHGWSMYKHAMKHPGEWYVELAPASKTGALNAEYLASELSRLQELHGEEYGLALWNQEYEVSFDAAIPGSIFGDVMAKAERSGRLGVVPMETGIPVHTGWDLGRTDDTAIWWFQVFAGEIRVVDFHASNGKDVPFYADVLDAKRRERGFEYGTHFLPHDARPRTLASPRSILQQFDEANREMGQRLGAFGIAPRLDKQEQIQALRATLGQCWIDAVRCEKGIEALKQYHREWDDEKKIFKDSPEHDWASHPCDAAMSMAVAWKRGKIPRVGGSAVANVGQTTTLTPGVTFGERKRQHLRARKLEREGMFS